MASRLGWLGLGVTIGSIATVRVERALRQKIRSMAPDAVARSVSQEIARTKDDLLESMKEGVRVARLERLSLKDLSVQVDGGRIQEFIHLPSGGIRAEGHLKVNDSLRRRRLGDSIRKETDRKAVHGL